MWKRDLEKDWTQQVTGTAGEDGGNSWMKTSKPVLHRERQVFSQLSQSYSNYA